MVKGFISLQNEFEALLPLILSDRLLHAKWLNTLSFLENCGARMIAACEHPTKVKTEILKHAAEEFRHAYYLKQQISRILPGYTNDYQSQTILGGIHTLQYLKKIELYISRFLKRFPYSLKQGAYILVTYAIERRAEELYPLYQKGLKKISSPVTVKSILLEEKQHLAEMEAELDFFPEKEYFAEQACHIEGLLCKNWIASTAASLKGYNLSS